MFQLYADAKPQEDFAILAKTNFFKETIDKRKELCRFRYRYQ